MKIYLIRHSFAENSYPDSERRLSNKGQTALMNSIDLWKKYEIKFDAVFSSPLLRAAQTAEIIKREFNIRNGVYTDKIFMPGSSTSAVIELLNNSEFESIAVIGHQPDLSYHIMSFVSVNGLNIKISPATLAEIIFTGRIRIGSGSLGKLLPPF
jgi:phosphohistidine phosphatase